MHRQEEAGKRNVEIGRARKVRRICETIQEEKFEWTPERLKPKKKTRRESRRARRKFVRGLAI